MMGCDFDAVLGVVVVLVVLAWSSPPWAKYIFMPLV
jgi:hypothetical protein